MVSLFQPFPSVVNSRVIIYKWKSYYDLLYSVYPIASHPFSVKAEVLTTSKALHVLPLCYHSHLTYFSLLSCHDTAVLLKIFGTLLPQGLFIGCLLCLGCFSFKYSCDSLFHLHIFLKILSVRLWLFSCLLYFSHVFPSPALFFPKHLSSSDILCITFYFSIYCLYSLTEL